MPAVVAGGLDPVILEYVDLLTMEAIRTNHGLDLGIPDDVRGQALAYLVIRLEGRHADRLEEDVEALGEQLVAPRRHGRLRAPTGGRGRPGRGREKAFWLAKANGADDIVDLAVPRAALPELMERVRLVGEAHGAWIAGCGHAGDGNVHLAVFQPDPERRHEVMAELFRAGVELGGVISGEHGIGLRKKPYFLALEDPAKVALMRRIKAAFDPAGILNPGKIFDLDEGGAR